MRTPLTIAILILIFAGIGSSYVFFSDMQPKQEERTFLDQQEAVVVHTQDNEKENGEVLLPIRKTGVRYIKIAESCNHDFVGDCVYVYTGPGEDFATTTQLRKGVVLRVGGEVTREEETWYKITFDNQWLRYPERVEHEWYVRASDVEVQYAPGDTTIWEDSASSTEKHIIIDKSEQKLYAYEHDTLFLETAVSTGLELSPTIVGTYTVFKKTPSRYMQGPIEDLPASDYYDLAGVPWNLYFTQDGAVIHGAYWHDSFGMKYSHGCVNLPPDSAERLYHWTPLKTTVTVRE